MTVLSAPTSRVPAEASHTLKLAVDLDIVMSSLGSAGIEKRLAIWMLSFDRGISAPHSKCSSEWVFAQSMKDS